MKRRRSESWAGFFFALPWIIGFCVFLAYPLLASVYYSFCDYSVLKPPVFIGIDNYRDLMHDSVFWTALKNTAFYAVFAIPFGAVVTLALALLLNSKVKGIPFYRTAFYLPSLVPQVSLAVLWMWMFNGEHGLINDMLLHFGIKGPPWLSDPSWTKPALILLGVWGVGNAVVIYLAGLQDVPTELIEAAELDGARPWQKTRHVTLPMISPVILFNVIMGIIGTLQIFTVPYVMFPGGIPARSTYFYTMYLFDNAFKFHKMGYACAMGWIMFLIIFALTLMSVKFSEKKVHYGGG